MRVSRSGRGFGVPVPVWARTAGRCVCGVTLNLRPVSVQRLRRQFLERASFGISTNRGSSAVGSAAFAPARFDLGRGRRLHTIRCLSAKGLATTPEISFPRSPPLCVPESSLDSSHCFYRGCLFLRYIRCAPEMCAFVEPPYRLCRGCQVARCQEIVAGVSRWAPLLGGGEFLWRCPSQQ